MKLPPTARHSCRAECAEPRPPARPERPARPGPPARANALRPVRAAPPRLYSDPLPDSLSSSPFGLIFRARRARRLSGILLSHLLDLAREIRAGPFKQSFVEILRACELRLARKFLLDDAAATPSHLTRARGVFEQRDDAFGHRRVVPDLNEVARLALDNHLARAAHVRRDDRAGRRHVFENRVGKTFGLRA